MIKTQKNKIFILGFFLVFLLLDIFFIHRLSDKIAIILIILWIANLLVLRLSYVISLRFSIICLLLAFFAQFGGNMIMVEKAISWFVIFLTIALVHSLRMSGDETFK